VLRTKRSAIAHQAQSDLRKKHGPLPGENFHVRKQHPRSRAMPASPLDAAAAAAARRRHMQKAVAAQQHAAPQQVHPTPAVHARSGSTGHSTRDTFTPATNGTLTQQRLAAAARNAALRMGGYQGQGRCAAGVERAIASAMHQSISGNGNTIGRSLTQHGFHEVNMSLQQALNTPGLVLTWQHTPTRLGQRYGHTAVTLGDGHTSASDFIERNTVAGSAGRTGLHIYAPDS
jgi:hypothetical protein